MFRLGAESLARITFSFVPPLEIFGFFYLELLLPLGLIPWKVVVVVIFANYSVALAVNKYSEEKLIKKKSLAVVFCPQRCDRMDVDSTRYWKNITSSRSAGSAVPAHQTQPTSVPPHLIGRSVAELFSHWPEPQRWPVLLVAGLGCVSVSRQKSPHPWGHFIPSISAAHASLQNVWKKISEMRSSISKSVKWEISGAGRPIVSQPKVAGSDPMIRNNWKWMDWWLCASTVLKLVFLHALRSILLFRSWCMKFLDQHLWNFGRNLKAMYKSNVILGKKVGTSFKPLHLFSIALQKLCH